MREATIFALSLVAGLVVLAAGQATNERYFDDLLSRLHWMTEGGDKFAAGLAYDLFTECGRNDIKSFAEQLDNQQSGAHVCTINALQEPFVLIKILRHVTHQSEESTLEYLDKIRDHTPDSTSKETIEKLIARGKDLCRQYVDEIASFFAEARYTEFANSRTYSRELAARNGCQIYLESDITEEAIIRVGELANAKFKLEGRVKPNKRRSN